MLFMVFTFWLIGILTGAAGLKLYQLEKSKALDLQPHQWLIIAIWYVVFVFLVAIVVECFLEGTPKAAGMVLLIFGGLLLIVTILLYRVVFCRKIGTLE